MLSATPSVDKPPYFIKKFERRLSKGKQLIYPLARKVGFLTDIFRYLYTTQNYPMLIKNEVTLVNLFINFLEKTNIPLVYLVRHPYGVIASTFKVNL